MVSGDVQDALLVLQLIIVLVFKPTLFDTQRRCTWTGGFTLCGMNTNLTDGYLIKLLFRILPQHLLLSMKSSKLLTKFV